MNIIDYLLEALAMFGIAQLVVLGVIYTSWILETALAINMLIDQFTWKKNPKLAESSTEGHTLIYVFLNGGVFVYMIVKGPLDFHWQTLCFWLGCMVLLIPPLRKIHSRLQGKDPNKAFDNYTYVVHFMKHRRDHNKYRRRR
jgi:hypothetical protein